MIVANCCRQYPNLCICDDGFNTCDKCESVFPVRNLVWETDKEWWDNKTLSNAEQNLYIALCKKCFKEFK
tara:strand:- start:727 stop:936 length:210 start_codon:yes stop_codon:yes gene_type:complete